MQLELFADKRLETGILSTSLTTALAYQDYEAVKLILRHPATIFNAKAIEYEAKEMWHRDPEGVGVCIDNGTILPCNKVFVLKDLLCHPSSEDFLQNLCKENVILFWMSSHLGKDIFHFILRSESVSIRLTIKYGDPEITLITDEKAIIKNLIQIPSFDLNMKIWNGETILTWAIKKKYIEISSIIFKDPRHKINTKNQFGETALMIAIKNGQSELEQNLLKLQGINLYLQDNDENTALLYAAMVGNTDLMRQLLSCTGFDVNARYPDGKTILMHAPQKGYAKLVNLLLQEDSLDINAQDNLGNTALTLTAIHHDNPIIISNLLDHGADPQTVNQEGYNAIMAAKHHKHRGICDLLKERHNNTVYRNASALPVSGMPAPEASAPPLELIEEYERLGFFGAPKVNDMTDTKPEPLKQFNL